MKKNIIDSKTARKIGINACIDKLGRDFVLKNRDFTTEAFGETENGVYCFVGVDKCHDFVNSDNTITLDSVSKFTYRASCNVDLEDGKITFIEN